MTKNIKVAEKRSTKTATKSKNKHDLRSLYRISAVIFSVSSIMLAISVFTQLGCTGWLVSSRSRGESDCSGISLWGLAGDGRTPYYIVMSLVAATAMVLIFILAIRIDKRSKVNKK